MHAPAKPRQPTLTGIVEEGMPHVTDEQVEEVNDIASHAIENPKQALSLIDALLGENSPIKDPTLSSLAVYFIADGLLQDQADNARKTKTLRAIEKQASITLSPEHGLEDLSVNFSTASFFQLDLDVSGDASVLRKFAEKLGAIDSNGRVAEPCAYSALQRFGSPKLNGKADTSEGLTLFEDDRILAADLHDNFSRLIPQRLRVEISFGKNVGQRLLSRMPGSISQKHTNMRISIKPRSKEDCQSFAQVCEFISTSALWDSDKTTED